MHAHTHIHTHTYIHTYIHTKVQECVWAPRWLTRAQRVARGLYSCWLSPHFERKHYFPDDLWIMYAYIMCMYVCMWCVACIPAGWAHTLSGSTTSPMICQLCMHSLYVYLCIHTHSEIWRLRSTCIHTYIRTYTTVFIPHTNFIPHTQRYMRAHIYTCIHTCKHTCMHTYLFNGPNNVHHTHSEFWRFRNDLHACTHTCIHANMQTYMHAYIPVR